MTLSIISTRTGPVSFSVPPFSRGDFSFMIGAETVATHTFETAPALDMILVPGGWGSAVLIEQNNTGIEDFVARRFNMTDYGKLNSLFSFLKCHLLIVGVFS